VISLDANAPDWAQRLVEQIKRRFEEDGRAPRRLKAYRIAELASRVPPARFTGSLVFIEDTARPAFSDGAAWRYVHDNSAV